MLVVPAHRFLLEFPIMDNLNTESNQRNKDILVHELQTLQMLSRSWHLSEKKREKMKVDLRDRRVSENCHSSDSRLHWLHRQEFFISIYPGRGNRRVWGGKTDFVLLNEKLVSNDLCVF